MGVDVEGGPFNSPEDLGDLSVEAELEANLTFAGGGKSTELDNFADTKTHVEEAVLLVFRDRSDVDHLSHEVDGLPFLHLTCVVK